MTTKDVIRETINTAHWITGELLKDLGDADLLHRPVPAMNHIAWQLGHLIASEQKMMADAGFAMPELPAGFDKVHHKDNASSDDAKQFGTKDQYLKLMGDMHAATLKHLDTASDAKLGEDAPEAMRSYAPKIGSVFNIVGGHEYMHQGQIVAVRRSLGKPVLF